jgi:hypothetical protein
MKIFHRFLISHTLYKKNMFQHHEFYINLTCFEFQLTKDFGGQNFSADKIFGSKSYFRQFCPPKFCPIWYLTFRAFWVSVFLKRYSRQKSVLNIFIRWK